MIRKPQSAQRMSFAHQDIVGSSKSLPNAAVSVDAVSLEKLPDIRVCDAKFGGRLRQTDNDATGCGALLNQMRQGDVLTKIIHISGELLKPVIFCTDTRRNKAEPVDRTRRSALIDPSDQADIQP